MFSLLYLVSYGVLVTLVLHIDVCVFTSRVNHEALQKLAVFFQNNKDDLSATAEIPDPISTRYTILTRVSGITWIQNNTTALLVAVHSRGYPGPQVGSAMLYMFNQVNTAAKLKTLRMFKFNSSGSKGFGCSCSTLKLQSHDLTRTKLVLYSDMLISLYYGFAALMIPVGRILFSLELSHFHVYYLHLYACEHLVNYCTVSGSRSKWTFCANKLWALRSRSCVFTARSAV